MNNDNWNSISKPPKKPGTYIYATKDYVGFCQYTARKNWYSDGSLVGGIVQWQPLPSLPEKK